jgi:hypothetical protein
MTDNTDMRSRLGMTLRWLGVSVSFLSSLDLAFAAEPVSVRRDITFFGLGMVIGFTGEFLLRRGSARRIIVAVLIVLVVAWTVLVLADLPG